MKPRRLVGVMATALTPITYFSLPIQGGVATLPEALPDIPLLFALAAAHGLMPAHPCLPMAPDYPRHLASIPWRASVFEAERPRLLPPIAQRRTIDGEAGCHARFTSAAKRGNLKDYFRVQSIPHAFGGDAARGEAGVGVFHGAIFGPDPFPPGEDSLVVRVGKNRSGMLLLERERDDRALRLNAYTAALFGKELPVERYMLHTLQASPGMSFAEAEQRLAAWG
jgi:hypothetical protein